MIDRRQQDTEEHERWTLESGLTRMERDVSRGRALLQILKAERQAAEPAEHEQEQAHEH